MFSYIFVTFSHVTLTSYVQPMKSSRWHQKHLVRVADTKVIRSKPLTMTSKL